MPRIRKKTSKRGTTHKRARIHHKAAESRKKSKKAAKKNPQWKSKHKKDPGIPNSFPYKDQILMEVAEERRQAAEEKQRRKDEKRASKARAGSEEDDSDGREESTYAFDGVANVDPARFTTTKVKDRNISSDELGVPDQEVPIFVDCDHQNLQSVLDHADVILELLDARDPLSFRSSHLEELAAARPGVRILLVLNKIDTCPREAIAAWASQLRMQYPTLLFRVASSFLPVASEVVFKPKEKLKLRPDDGLGVDSILECLGQWAREKAENSPLVVAVVGLANSGKSTLINSLLRKQILPFYNLSSSPQGPTTTTLPQQVTINIAGMEIQIIDTPGLSWHTTENTALQDVDAIRARDILLRNKGRIDRLKDPAPAIAHIVSRADTQDLMLLYNLPSFEKGNANAFLAGVARARQLIMKRGTLDLIGASRIVLRDWSTSKFPWYTIPPPSTPSVQQQNHELATIYAKDESILSMLQTRKEMRKGGGLVKFTPGTLESRKVALEEPWIASEAVSGGDDAGGEGEGEGIDDASDADEDADDESSGEDHDAGDDAEDDADSALLSGIAADDEGDIETEETAAPVPSKSRKRPAPCVPSVRPAKKVTFDPNCNGFQQSRAVSREQKSKLPLSTHGKGVASKAKRGAVTAFSKTGVTNLTTKSKKSTATQDLGESEAYDFGKYFGGL